jgi:multicomponent Na+:H+ antiporter subunit D
MIAELSPGLILILGALLVPALGGWLRAAWLLALPVLAFFQTVGLEPGMHGAVTVFELELTTLRVDALALVFVYAFLVALFFGMIYQLHVPGALEPTASLIYAGSALGAVFAGDLVTLFLFWEGTSVASVFLIWARGSERALAAGTRYLIVQVGSGVLLLAGAIVHFGETGSIAFESFELTSTAGLLILIGFGIKAAFPLLHSWLQDAYPEATVTGTVILSIFTTKLAIYALARGFAGTEVLVPIGVAMAVFPIFWALIEDDFRRVLAWGLNSQLGIMVTGIGIGSDLAVNGAVAHAACSIVYQALLFMGMGAVLYRTGSARGSDLSGIARDMPWTSAFYGVGAVSIAALPLTAGFVSKSMIISAAGYEHMFVPWLFLLGASALSLVYAGLRIPFSAFLGPRMPGNEVREAPANMLIAMGLAAALCILVGVYPAVLYDLLPRPYEYRPYTAEHLLTQMQLLAFAALAFALLYRAGIFPRDVRGTLLETDWLWRRPGARAVGGAVRGALLGWSAVAGRGSAAGARLFEALYRQHGPAGRLASTRPSGSMALWMTVLLAAFLVFSFF